MTGNTYVCKLPSCKQEFKKWSLCVAHLQQTQHFQLSRNLQQQLLKAPVLPQITQKPPVVNIVNGAASKEKLRDEITTKCVNLALTRTVKIDNLISDELKSRNISEYDEKRRLRNEILAIMRKDSRIIEYCNEHGLITFSKSPIFAKPPPVQLPNPPVSAAPAKPANPPSTVSSVKTANPPVSSTPTATTFVARLTTPAKKDNKQKEILVRTTDSLQSISTYQEQIEEGIIMNEAKEANNVEFGDINSTVADLLFNQLKYKPKNNFNRGYSLANAENSRASFSEAAYLGTVGEEHVYLNTHEPFCVATVGVQGAGKSHTMAVILESCLLPFAYPVGQEAIRLHQPMTALVLHYDQNVSSVCEATGLISAVPRLQKLLGSGAAVSREKMVVLVSPTYYRQRKKFYGDYCTVKPLLFKWETLSADHIRKLMRINEGDNQLYVASMLQLLRSYQRDAVVPEFQGFLQQIRSVCNAQGQSAPLTQRIALLESIIAESDLNIELRKEAADLASSIGPGCLVIADLTDPLLSSDEANGIFQVLTEQFRVVPTRNSCGKLLALDEAHKFMHGESTDGLSNSIVNAARLMRHDGMRVVVSTQSPKALAPELLELVSVAILHRFHSKDWFAYLQTKIKLDSEMFDKIIELNPGSAHVFASRHLIPNAPSVFHLSVRNRITADRGYTKTNKSK